MVHPAQPGWTMTDAGDLVGQEMMMDDEQCGVVTAVEPRADGGLVITVDDGAGDQASSEDSGAFERPTDKRWPPDTEVKRT